jgi:putative transposase
MPRALRSTVGGLVYHVLNRANEGLQVFRRDGDYEAFEAILEEAHRHTPVRILAYCLMPTHWHLVLWPHEGRDRDVSAFMHWLTSTHSCRRRAFLGTTGMGHLYQGRFKSFPVQEDAHFLTVCRYVERNALRAGLTTRAEEWRWSSLWWRLNGTEPQRKLLAPWPMEQPSDWISWVNRPETRNELEAVRQSIRRGSPCGDELWMLETAKRLNLESTIRARGRPWPGA